MFDDTYEAVPAWLKFGSGFDEEFNFPGGTDGGFDRDRTPANNQSSGSDWGLEALISHAPTPPPLDDPQQTNSDGGSGDPDDEPPPTELDEIVVTGFRIAVMAHLAGGGTSGAGDSGGEEQNEIDPDSPGVDGGGDCGGDIPMGPMPGVDINALRDLVNAIGQELATWNHNLEHSVLVFLDASGNLDFTHPRTGTNGSVDVRTTDVPDGSTIVAWIHTHPDNGGFLGAYPSNEYNAEDGPGDWAIRDMMVTAGANSTRYDVDPDMLIYILDTVDDLIREYDRMDRDESSPGELTSC